MNDSKTVNGPSERIIDALVIMTAGKIRDCVRVCPFGTPFIIIIVHVTQLAAPVSPPKISDID